MRSPVIAFSIFAAAAVSPTLVSAAPATPNVGGGALVPTPGFQRTDAITGVGPHLPARPQAQPHSHENTNPRHKQHSRALDGGTAGGNAYSGSTSDATGGSIQNEASDDPDDEITNNTASGYLSGAITCIVSHFQHLRCRWYRRLLCIW